MLGIIVPKYANRQQKRATTKELSRAIRTFEKLNTNFLNALFHLEGTHFYWYNGKYNEKRRNTYANVYSVYLALWAGAIEHHVNKCKYISFNPDWFEQTYQPLETPIKK